MPPPARATTSPDARFAPCPAASDTAHTCIEYSPYPTPPPRPSTRAGNRTAHAAGRPLAHESGLLQTRCASPPRATSTCAPIADGLHPVSARVVAGRPRCGAQRREPEADCSREGAGVCVRAARPPRLRADRAAQRTRRGSSTGLLDEGPRVSQCIEDSCGISASTPVSFCLSRDGRARPVGLLDGLTSGGRPRFIGCHEHGGAISCSEASSAQVLLSFCHCPTLALTTFSSRSSRGLLLQILLRLEGVDLLGDCRLLLRPAAARRRGRRPGRLRNRRSRGRRHRLQRPSGRPSGRRPPPTAAGRGRGAPRPCTPAVRRPPPPRSPRKAPSPRGRLRHRSAPNTGAPRPPAHERRRCRG